MARITAGGTRDDQLFYVDGGGNLKATSATLRWYSVTTGELLTCLLNGQPVTAIPVPSNGRIPAHQWPDGVTAAYADTGLPERTLVTRSTPTTTVTLEVPDASSSTPGKVRRAGPDEVAADAEVNAYVTPDALGERLEAFRQSILGTAAPVGGELLIAANPQTGAYALRTTATNDPTKPVIWRGLKPPQSGNGYALAIDSWESTAAPGSLTVATASQGADGNTAWGSWTAPDRFFNLGSDYGDPDARAFACITGLAIPPAMTVKTARLALTAWGAAGTLGVNMHAVAQDNPAAPTNPAALKALPLSQARVPWTAAASAFSNMAKVYSPDLAKVIQEQIDRPGWEPGNNIVLIADEVSSTGSGSFTVFGYGTGADAPYAPVLEVTYE